MQFKKEELIKSPLNYDSEINIYYNNIEVLNLECELLLD